MTQNGTYLVAQEQISDCGNLCLTVIRKCHTDVCALRLDFVAFNLLGPANTQEQFTFCRDSLIASSVSTKTKPIKSKTTHKQTKKNPH